MTSWRTGVLFVSAVILAMALPAESDAGGPPRVRVPTGMPGWVGNTYVGAAGEKYPGGMPYVGPSMISPALAIPPSLLAGARYFNYSQILYQTLHEAGNGEVMTYLRNPVAWQQKLSKIKAVELGLPQMRLILADGTVIRSYLRPPIPNGWRYHYFTDPLPPGWKRADVFDTTHLYDVMIPPTVQAAVVPVK